MSSARPEYYIVKSDKDTHFTGALAQNAHEEESLQLHARRNRCVILDVTVLSDQNLAWDVYFWSTDAFDNADLDLDSAIGKVSFVVADGEQIGGTGAYRYHANGLAIPYNDEDETGELHVSVVNRSGTSKNAGATGEVVFKAGYAT